ncbi:hypothetical protein, conserved [Leishmania tarentolae]|uniref:Uncharacterized protein n=1 Tax=Leishmania tarentolae TaxID=5689 RepID=A0A640KVG5_LEITA|nr:hypothetical protein, conserved [Leishmania tarentolae]
MVGTRVLPQAAAGGSAQLRCVGHRTQSKGRARLVNCFFLGFLSSRFRFHRVRKHARCYPSLCAARLKSALLAATRRLFFSACAVTCFSLSLWEKTCVRRVGVSFRYGALLWRVSFSFSFRFPRTGFSFMSSARRSRNRNGKCATGETYSRADEALWDDAYLLKLFNEQLDNAEGVKDAREETQDDVDSVPSTETDGSDTANTDVGDSATSSSRSVAERERCGPLESMPAKSEMTARGFPTLNSLPEDIQALVQSFYSAGFEAGRFVGRSEESKKCCRKRYR